MAVMPTGAASPLPLPSLTGGSAAPSSAFAGDIRTNVYSATGSNFFWLSVAAVILGVIWMKKKNK